MNLPKKLSTIPKLKVHTPTQRANRGFTLIEILIVVAIMAILVSIGAASYMAAQRNAHDQTRTRDLNQVKTALEQYFELNLNYPETGTGADAGEIKCPSGSAIDWGDEWVCDSHTYMRALPEDPTTGQTYCYQNPGGTSTFEVFARMENSNNGNLSSDETCNTVDYNYKLENEK